MTRAHIQLLVAVIAGLVVLGGPLVLLVRAMRRDERRTRLTEAPLTGLVVLCVVSLGAWLWIAHTDVTISGTFHGPIQGFLLVIAAIAVYLLWLAMPVAAATWLVFKLPDAASRGRYARMAITAIGIVAAVTGGYYAYLTSGAIWDFVLLLRAISGLPKGGAGLPILLAGFIAFLLVVVLGSVTALLMLIAAWGLEPRRRWRDWRGIRPYGSELPPS